MAITGEPTTPRRPWIVSALSERLLTKFIAIMLAIVVWGIVRSEETTEVVLTVPLIVVLDPSLELASTVPDSVGVVVTGRVREVLK